jgi:ketosteroid isomerase-like protein
MPFNEDGLTAADLAEINRMYDSFGPSLVAGDWGKLLAHYTDDAVVMPPNSPPVVGLAAIREWAEAGPTFKSFAIEASEIVGEGSLAFVRGHYRMTIEIPGVPQPIDDVGSFIEIREKQADGRWLLARDIFNSDLEPAG